MDDPFGDDWPHPAEDPEAYYRGEPDEQPVPPRTDIRLLRAKEAAVELRGGEARRGGVVGVERLEKLVDHGKPLTGAMVPVGDVVTSLQAREDDRRAPLGVGCRDEPRVACEKAAEVSLETLERGRTEDELVAEIAAETERDPDGAALAVLRLELRALRSGLRQEGHARAEAEDAAKRAKVEAEAKARELERARRAQVLTQPEVWRELLKAGVSGLRDERQAADWRDLAGLTRGLLDDELDALRKEVERNKGSTNSSAVKTLNAGIVVWRLGRALRGRKRTEGSGFTHAEASHLVQALAQRRAMG